MLNLAFTQQAYQLVDSTITETRRYWRQNIWKLPANIVTDPRSMQEIFGKWPNWRNPNPADMPTLPTKQEQT